MNHSWHSLSTLKSPQICSRSVISANLAEMFVSPRSPDRSSNTSGQNSETTRLLSTQMQGNNP